MIVIYWPRRWASMRHMEKWMSERGLSVWCASRSRRPRRFCFVVWEKEPWLL